MNKTRDALLSELTVELEKVKAEAHQANKKVEQLQNENQRNIKIRTQNDILEQKIKSSIDDLEIKKHQALKRAQCKR